MDGAGALVPGCPKGFGAALNEGAPPKGVFDAGGWTKGAGEPPKPDMVCAEPKSMELVVGPKGVDVMDAPNEGVDVVGAPNAGVDVTDVPNAGVLGVVPNPKVIVELLNAVAAVFPKAGEAPNDDGSPKGGEPEVLLLVPNPAPNATGDAPNLLTGGAPKPNEGGATGATPKPVAGGAAPTPPN
jgi:hypothetical protein